MYCTATYFLHFATRMEGILAMNILCSTSQVNLDALHLVQSLAAGHQTLSKSTLKTNPSSRSTIEHAGKKAETRSGASSKLNVNRSTPVKGKTEFLLPSQEYCDLNSRKAPLLQSTVNKVATLNMLGMQPDFNVADVESVYSADQTVMSYQTLAERTRRNLAKAASADDVKLVQNRAPLLLRYTNFVTVLNSTLTASSVGTQSLIANESIPDALPSTEFSNITMDLGSITTIDPVESSGKSVGLFTISTPKHLDRSVSNSVSPGPILSGYLTSKEDLVPSPIPELSVELSSIASGSRAGKPSVPVATVSGVAHKDGTDKLKRVELNLDLVRSLDDQHSQETATQADEDAVQPQHVKLVIAPSSRPDTICTHYTHSTAPLAEGANMLGSQVQPSTILRDSMLSSNSSPSSCASRRLTQLECWPGEVALTYTVCMASITIYGKTSLIQQTALEGPKVKRATSSVQVEGEDESISINCGLLELAQFETREGEDTEETSGKEDFTK